MEDSSSQTGSVFLSFSAQKLKQMGEQLDACLARLSDEQIWQRNGSHENAIGNLILHVCGNARQWVIAGVGERPDVRDRDAEFAADGGPSSDQLRAKLRETIEETLRVLESVTTERLLQRIEPQGRRVTVLEAIYQVVGHVQQHAGQVIFATKMMVGEDLKLTKL